MVFKIEYNAENKPVFAKGVCFYKVFVIFVFGCLLGTYYEEILNFFKEGVWDSRAGVVFGPFNPIYGFGLAACVWILGQKPRPWYQTWIYGALIGGGCEYILNFLQEKVIHSLSWDYSDKFLNLNGRTTIPFMIFWGLGALIIITFVYPFLSRVVEAIPYKIGKIFTNFFLVFLTIDMAMTGISLIRQSQRHQGIEATNPIDSFFDTYFSDEYLETIFPNMDFGGGKNAE